MNKKETDISQENVVQTREKVNRLKTREVVEKEKEKTKASVAEKTKQQRVANQSKNP